MAFILGSHVLKQLVSVNDRATALRSARPLSSFQNNGSILVSGSHNAKETLKPWKDPLWERSYFSVWLGTKGRRMWDHWLHITPFSQKVEIIQTYKNNLLFFPHSSISPDILFEVEQPYKRSQGIVTSHMNCLLASKKVNSTSLAAEGPI
jgi:hypothetical protein